MNAERLLEVYEQISEAPDAIARLRQFVLDLAVRGKLVAQNASDEPASKQLDRIALEKARLVKAKQIRKPKALPEKEALQIPFATPEGWSWACIDELSPRSLTDGDWIEKKDQAEDGGVRLIQLADVGVGSFLNKSSRFITSETEVRLNCTRLSEGDILIARLPNPIGRACIFPELEQPAITAVDVAILRPDGNISADYIVVAVNSPPTRDQIEAYGKGATRFRVSTGHLKTVLIPVPPLAEQHRIAAKVDELMALCDRLEAARKTREEVRDKLTAASLARLTATNTTGQAEPAKVGTGSASGTATTEDDFPTHAAFTLEALPALTTRPDQIKTLRQTILNLAVRGKIVEQDPADEPVSDLISHMTKIRAAERRRKGSFEQISGRDLPFELPRGWAPVRFGEVFSIRTGFAFKSSTYSKEGLLIFRVVNFSRDGTFDLSDVKFFPETLLDDKIKSFLLEEGEILMVMVGGTIGKTTRVTQEILPALLNQNMWRIQSYGRTLSNDYEYLLIRTINQEVDSVTASTHGHFAMSDYEQKPIAIPPLAEQHRIVAKVDALMALCDRLEAALTTAETTRTRLLEALLHDALNPAADTLEAAE